MSNSGGNPQIVERGKATRFGAGRNCPRAAQRQASPPWSIHRAVRRIACACPDLPAGGVTAETIRHALRRVLGGATGRLTGAEASAVEMWVAALSGNLSAMDRLVSMIDGALPRDVPQR